MINSVVKIDGDVSLDLVIDGSMDTDSVLDGESEKILTRNTGTLDHDKLYNRDIENQHPISSIMRLQSELNARPDEHISNFDIMAILNA